MVCLKDRLHCTKLPTAKHMYHTARYVQLAITGQFLKETDELLLQKTLDHNQDFQWCPLVTIKIWLQSPEKLIFRGMALSYAIPRLHVAWGLSHHWVGIFSVFGVLQCLGVCEDCESLLYRPIAFYSMQVPSGIVK